MKVYKNFASWYTSSQTSLLIISIEFMSLFHGAEFFFFNQVQMKTGIMLSITEQRHAYSDTCS